MSGGHLCKAEAPTEAEAETVARRSRDGRREIIAIFSFSLPQSFLKMTAPSSEGAVNYILLFKNSISLSQSVRLK